MDQKDEKFDAEVKREGQKLRKWIKWASSKEGQHLLNKEQKMLEAIEKIKGYNDLWGEPFDLTDFQRSLLIRLAEVQYNRAFRKGLLYGIVAIIILWVLFSGPSREVLDPYVPFGD